MACLHRATALCRLVVLTSLPVPVLAQEAPLGPFAISPLTITATRLPTPEAELGSSMTIITGGDIALGQKRDLPDILSDVPGLNVIQSGGPGGTTSVFMRGTNPNHTKVFIDGIDVGDPSTVDGSFDLAHLLAGDIDRVEVLRGPQSGLYGSDAIGGVINVITKTGSGPPHFTASLEGGSFGTLDQSAGVSGSHGGFSYTFDAAHVHVGGTQVTPPDLVPPGRLVNKDSYDNVTAATKLGARLGENFDVGFVLRYIDSDLHFTSDDFVGPESFASDGTTQQLFTRGTAHLTLFDGLIDQVFGAAYTRHRSRNFDPNPFGLTGGNDPSVNAGDRLKFDWQGSIQATKNHTVVLGVEHQTEEINSTTPVQASVGTDAGFAELQSDYSGRFFNVLSVRYDANGQFGGKLTYHEAPALLIPETGTKLKGSVGSGFKAPSLSELFDNFPQFNFAGNPNLRPETSIGWDAGFEQRLFGDRVRFGSTYFRNDIHDLITFNSSFTSYTNIGRASSWGAESFVSANPLAALTLRADHTYTVAQDDILHQELLRRPRNKMSLTASWQAGEGMSVSATVLRLGPWIDVNRSGTVSGLVANGYTVVNLAGSYEVRHGIAAFARVTNLLDRHYQDPTGLLHPSLGVFVGVRVAFDASAAGS